mgnify:CR=1 FL=1
MDAHNYTSIVETTALTAVFAFKDKILRAVAPAYGWQQLVRALKLGQLKVACPIVDGEYAGVALYEFVAYQNGTVYLRIVGLAGNEVERWLEALVKWAIGKCQDLALDGIEICGRKGWAKVLAKYEPQEFAYLRLEVPWDSEQARP